MKKEHVPFFPNIAPLLSPTFSFLSTFRGYLQLPRTNEAKEAKIKRRRENAFGESFGSVFNRNNGNLEGGGSVVYVRKIQASPSL